MRFALGFLVLIAAATAYAQAPATIHGTVRDSSGAAVSGARIEFKSESGELFTVSDSLGSFSIAEASGPGTLFVRYPGFAPVALPVDAAKNADDLRVTLNPATSVERIEVSTQADDRVIPVPTSQYSIPRQEIDVSGSLSVDEILRQTPGFTLFRRAGSLFANPTTQGVSLRGVGANGTSRATVLVDGIPLNDPFGGWVYWNRVPRVDIESLQVFNGGSSDMYGGGALGGVVNIQTRAVTRSFASLEASYGNEDTKFISLAAGTVAGKWSFSVSGQGLRTAGYIIVPENLRGTIDIRAGTGDLSGVVTASRKLGDNGQAFVRVSTLSESRQNGTPLTANDTSIPEIDLGLDWSHSTAGAFSIRAYATKEKYHQGFSSPGAGRNSEAQTDLQRSPSGQVGFASQWRRTFAGRHAVTAGVESRGVHGDSFERFFSATTRLQTSFSDAGGRQTSTGIFGQDAYHFAENWVLTLGGRFDTWSNTSGYTYSIPVPSGAPTSTHFAERRENAFSPRVSLLRTFGSIVAVNASFYRAFRPPNLNELYRGFRVGALLTNANSTLIAERLIGGETGISVTPWSQRLTLRGNFFWSDISNPVTNVPLSATVSQRQNLGVTRARGAEFSGEARLPYHMQLTAAYILTRSTVLNAPGQSQFLGLWVPQVPRHQFNFQWSYTDRNWTAGLQGRVVGMQFDDLSVRFPMDKFFTLDAEVSRRLLPHTQIFFGAQNLTDSRYSVARTPILTVGPPTLVRGGLRFDFF